MENDQQKDEKVAVPDNKDEQINNKNTHTFVYFLLLVAILVAGAYFRFIGLNWGEDHHLHPDERFLTMVESSITPVNSISEFFDTANSSLNPHNRGYSFYVYGTLPLFIVRYVAQWMGMTGYSDVYLVGRFSSATIDLLTVILVFAIAMELYRKKSLALTAAAFSAFSVMQIQLSHYFTVDNFTNFFSTLALFFAIKVLKSPRHRSTISVSDSEMEIIFPKYLKWLVHDWNSLTFYALFGLTLGLAMASKVSAAPLAILLPTVAVIHYVKHHIIGDESTEERRKQEVIIFRNLLVAGVLAFLVFRVFQPYAFTGPGFFNIRLNPLWIENLKDISAQSGGDVDFPPALQWARRPVWFSWYNMVFWGLGLPLGLLSWTGFAVMAWRIFGKKEWLEHGLLWGWTAIYFTWQSLNASSSMRYQILVYPTLAIIAAWGISALYNTSRSSVLKKRAIIWPRIIAVIIGAAVVSSTAAWAFAFTRIYTRQVTRVEASYWIYQNVPGPINLKIETQDGEFNQVLSFRLGSSTSAEKPYIMAFTAQNEGILKEINFSHIVDNQMILGEKILQVIISDDRSLLNPGSQVNANAQFTVGSIISDFNSDGDGRGNQYSLIFDKPLVIEKDKTYYVALSTNDSQVILEFAGPISLGLIQNGEIIRQSLPEPVSALHSRENQVIPFTALRQGELKRIYLPHIVDWEGYADEKILQVVITDPSSNDQKLASIEIHDEFKSSKDGRGDGFWVEFDKSIPLQKGQDYFLEIENLNGPGALAIYGSRQANESSWDDVIPLGVDGYNPFDYKTGVYRTELNFEMYWDDNEDKRDRFQSILDQADYIFITSNRQWGTTVRVPERYPLTSAYYRSLLGCPDDKDIVWCYSVAETGMFQGTLGFDLIKVFQSDPNLSSLRLNTQFAEEAFTVYDHPKVLIFQKRPDYNSDRVRTILNSVDLSQVIHITPGKTPDHPANLLLPVERLTVQQAGGTWSDLFNRNIWINRYPVLGVLFWYLVVCLLGWVVYPFVRLAFRNLSDRGYPLCKTVGFLLLAYPVWLAGSYGIAFNRLTISIIFSLLIILNLGLFIIQKERIISEWKQPGNRKYFLIIEAISLAFFVFFLLVRVGNPDLWHPYKGGEKPMDFSYFNAVLKSTTFPPYDPWFSGGYINYYYFGFVLVGVLVKWLGIVPSIAYNFILPTLFSTMALGAFSVAWNLISPRSQGEKSAVICLLEEKRKNYLGWFAGLSAAIGTLVLGNLGTVRMIWHGLQRLAAPDGTIDGADFIQRWIWSFEGIIKFIAGTPLPYPPGDWYWIPSRAIPGNTITEFPFFTFLYADPHAHLIALPFTVLALAWGLSILQGKWRWGDENSKYRWLYYGACFVMGGLIIGALRVINTWDMPTFLTLGIVTILYTSVRANSQEKQIEIKSEMPESSLTSNIWSPKIRAWVIGIISAGILVLLSFFLYQPYTNWYGAGYNAFDSWEGSRTPFWSYVTHWGLFLFVIISWMVWETIDWMKKTPLSSLYKLKPYKGFLLGLLILCVAAIVAMEIIGVWVGWIVALLGVWAVVLIIRPDQTDEKRMVLFWIGAALALTLAVELIVLRGDVDRMNTVFKFYLQAWTLLATSAAVSLIWLFSTLFTTWLPRLRTIWKLSLATLVIAAALFPIMGGIDKIRDRMSQEAPHSLDGMSYMAYSTYVEKDINMDLSQDYRAIIWMQDHIKGSPVIVEANIPEYRWGSRFTIYTGLPGVVGWNWHQRQQRAITPSEWVTNRIDAINDFYQTEDVESAVSFLQKYNVSYIIVGQLEEACYPGTGLDKFSAMNGKSWNQVYHDADTTIYEVLR